MVGVLIQTKKSNNYKDGKGYLIVATTDVRNLTNNERLLTGQFNQLQ
jgi:hypothetical protein